MRTITLITALLACCLPCLSSADTPARLVVGEDSIEETLRLPAGLKPGRYEVDCEIEISSGGRTRYVGCYQLSGSAPSELRDAVVDAVRLARYEPATRAGNPTDVYMVLGVLVDTTLGESLVLAVPNNGADRQRYGLLYSAPQRFIKLQRSAGLLPLGVQRDAIVWMKMRVDENGNVTDYVLENANRASFRVVDTVRSHIETMEFMPGYYRGKPVVMFYMEPYYSLVR